MADMEINYRVIFNDGKQSEFLRMAAKDVGSLRKLAKMLDIKWGYFWYYIKEEISLPCGVFKKVLPLTGLSERETMETWIKELLPKNWGAVKGGNKTGIIVKRKIMEDAHYKKMWIMKCKKGGNKIKGQFIKNWDVGFRKAGKRTVIGPNGERMFNRHERGIALWLASHKTDYEYEKLVRINGNYYFPDFIVNDVIIERCGFSTKYYLNSLRKKLGNYKRFWKGRIIVVCPRKFANNIRRTVATAPKVDIILEEDGLESLGEKLTGAQAGNFSQQHTLQSI